MIKRLALAAAAAALLAGMTGCGGGATSNEAACSDALQEIMRGDAPLAKPAACKGITEDRMGELSYHGSPEAADEAAAEEAAEAAEQE